MIIVFYFMLDSCKLIATKLRNRITGNNKKDHIYSVKIIPVSLNEINSLMRKHLAKKKKVRTNQDQVD